ncbi:hypothetical protein AVEN_165404-1 [Araneus ventricosus]|uniref:Uncharacterized protein n=1 Tax=Araneus ventricosus TaxID=182803 RepID=A0A4Y2AUK1_ARAVE|nr:hypothetical protein AVEN_165404-1 [Araneus ventricosus]
MTPEMESPLQAFTPHVELLSTTYDLTCNRLHTRRIFGGIGFEPGALLPRGRDLTSRPPQPYLIGQKLLLKRSKSKPWRDTCNKYPKYCYTSFISDDPDIEKVIPFS